MNRMLTARKTTPKVTAGRVRKKNRTAQTQPSTETMPRIVRKPPRRGLTHVMSRSDIRKFLKLLPEWQELVARLKQVVLEVGNAEVDATYSYGDSRISIQPWPNLTQLWTHYHVWAHDNILSMLDVPMEGTNDAVICRFTKQTARAYMLLHVFMHELGHHRHWTEYRIHNHKRAETHAENTALAHEWYLWERYIKAFGDPRGR